MKNSRNLEMFNKKLQSFFHKFQLECVQMGESIITITNPFFANFLNAFIRNVVGGNRKG